MTDRDKTAITEATQLRRKPRKSRPGRLSRSNRVPRWGCLCGMPIQPIHHFQEHFLSLGLVVNFVIQAGPDFETALLTRALPEAHVRADVDDPVGAALQMQQ